MRGILCVIGLAFVSTSACAAEPDVCEADIANLNMPEPVFAGVKVSCDASQVGPGELNECGMIRWAEKKSPAVIALIAENDAYMAECGGKERPECSEGKFSGQYLRRRLLVSLEELNTIDDIDALPQIPLAVRLDSLCDLSRKGILVQAKPKNAVIFGDGWSFTRDVPDPQSSRGKPFEAPFMLNAVQDREKDSAYVGIYGTVGYFFRDKPGSYSLSATAKIDSAAGSDRKKSSVAIAVNWSKYYWSKSSPWFDSVLFKVSPAYLTDRGFEREIYQVSTSASLASKRFGSPGTKQCPGDCDAENTFEFYWVPTLALDSGKVVDAGGSDALLPLEGDDPFVRLVPSLTMTFNPVAWSPRLSFQLQYAHRYDLTQGWDRGLGTLSASYSFAPNAFWSLAWRKGRQDGSFESIDTLLFGIGLKQ